MKAKKVIFSFLIIASFLILFFVSLFVSYYWLIPSNWTSSYFSLFILVFVKAFVVSVIISFPILWFLFLLKIRYKFFIYGVFLLLLVWFLAAFSKAFTFGLIPVYPNSTSTFANRLSGMGEGIMENVIEFKTKDQRETIVEFYKKQLKTNGLIVEAGYYSTVTSDYGTKYTYYGVYCSRNNKKLSYFSIQEAKGSDTSVTFNITGMSLLPFTCF